MSRSYKTTTSRTPGAPDLRRVARAAERWQRWLAIALAAGIALLIAALAVAGDRLPGPVPATVLRTIDGDTLSVEAAIWPDHRVIVSVRLLGLDTPELRGKCPAEVTAARAARAALADLAGERVMLADIRHDKYAGRVLARVTAADGTDIAAALIAAGHARPYDGGRRGGWCK